MPGCSGNATACSEDGEVEVASLQSLWLLLCTFLVVSMQLGFAMLEVGGVREAHRMTVLAKNVMDSVVTCLAFALATRFWNLTLVQDANGAESYESLLSNWAFCATCATICSGAMAERAHMLAYLAYAAVMGCVVYPPLAEGVWGRGGFFLYDQLHGRFRQGISYHDCAGSGVVHLSGGCAALAGCLLLGRRIMCRELEPDDEGRNWMDAEAGKAEELGLGDEDWQRRFDDEARDKLEFQTCSYLQVMGMFTLWVGWYGFNAGSVLSADPSGRLAGLVSWNTTAAGSAAGLGACLYLYGFHLNLDVGFLCNGVLSGLVACTALCDVATPTSSIVIGLLSGLVVYPACSRLMQWARIDDPVDAVAVHAGSGFFGVVATAFCTPPCEKLKMAGTLRGAEAEFCSDEHTLLGQLEMQLWGALLIVCWAFLMSMFFFLFCAVCERVKSLELKHVRDVQDILSQMDLNGSLSEAADSLLGIRLASVGERSSLVRQLLEQRAQGNLKEMKDFQAALVELRCGWRQSALEPKTSCFVEAMVHLVYACWPLRKIATLRLRIHPSAELSGLGALKAEGGKVYEALHRAAHQIAELRAEHRSVHSPLKRNVKELSLIVKSQDILLRALTRKRSPRRGTGTLQSVAEEDEREKHTPTKPYSGRASAAAEVERPSQPTLHSAFPASSSEPYSIHRVQRDSTLSDDTLSPPMSVNSTTPRPSILGRELHRNSNREVNEVADQLSILLQTQQQLMSALAQGAPPISNPQFAEPPAPQCEPPLLSQRHVLAAALEVLAARGYSGNPSADATPRTLDMVSRGPSSLSLGSGGSAATQRDR